MAKENAPEMEPTGSGKKNESKKLVALLLLLVIAAASYLYLFTGIFKPQEEAAAPQPEAATQVKKPLPPHPEGKGAGDQPANKEVARVDEKPAVQPPAAVKAAPETAAKPEPPKKKEAAPPAKEQVKQAVAEKAAKAEPAKQAERPAEKKEAAPVAAAKEKGGEKAGETVAAAKVPAKATQTAAAPGKVAAGKVEATKAKPAGKEAAPAAKGGRYTLLIGDFVQDKNFAALQAKLRKQYKPLARKSIQKVEPMNRLFVGEFADYDAAAAELGKLKPLTRDAFSIEKGGKYYVYAGSYFGGELAASEKKRLTGKGVKIELQKVEVPVSIVRLTAGRFPSRDEAKKAVAALEKKGIKATVTEVAAR